MSFLERLLGMGGNQGQPVPQATSQAAAQAQPMGQAPTERRGMFGLDFSDPKTAAALQMISNGLTPSVGAPRPMFQNVQQVTANAMGLQEAQRKRAMEEKKLQDETMRKNRTLGWIEENAPQYLEAVDIGLVSANDVYKNLMGGNKDEFAKRAEVAGQYGLAEGTPEYQAFVLTGKYAAPGMGGEPKYGMNGIPMRGPDGQLVYGQLTSDNRLAPAATPEGYEPLSPFDKSFDASRGKVEGQTAGESSMQVYGARQTAANIDFLINDLKNDPGLPSVLGPVDSRTPNIRPEAVRAQTKIDQIGGQAFLQARQMLKGGGAITDFESNRAEQAYVRLNQAQSEEDFKAALDEFNAAVQDGVKKLEMQAGQGAAPAPSMGGGQRLRFNPQTGEFE
jgi:hypothetical protein